MTKKNIILCHHYQSKCLLCGQVGTCEHFLAQQKKNNLTLKGVVEPEKPTKKTKRTLRTPPVIPECFQEKISDSQAIDAWTSSSNVFASPTLHQPESPVTEIACPHYEVLCLACGKRGTAAHLLGKRGPRCPKSAAQSRAAGRLGGFPLGRKRIETSLQDAAKVLASNEGDGLVMYRGVAFERLEAVASKYAAQRGGRAGITITGAMHYIRAKLKELGVTSPRRDWGGIRRGEMSIDQVARQLESEEGPNVASYRGFEISRASVIAYGEENDIQRSFTKIAKEYIRSAKKKIKLANTQKGL